jgi:preprotein translocase subunit Sss1
MFIIPYNTTLWICAAIVVGMIGFIIYGLIKGFENTFRDE